MTRATRLATAVIFFFSGFAALTYQVVWQRVLTQEIGVDTVSVAFIVTIFMVGLGFGALYGGRFAARNPRRLAAAYAVIEMVIGACGLLSVPAIRIANRSLSALPVDSILLDFLGNCVVLVVPIFLMGMTSPIIMELMKDTLVRWGRVVGLFYGLNVLGAAAGAIVAGLLLIELIGLRGSSWLAAGVNLVIGVLFWIMRRRLCATPASVAPPTGIRRAQLEHSTRVAVHVKIACVLFGFVTLSMQMIYFRILANYFTLSAIVFPIMLAAFLLLMSGGQFLSGWAIDRLRPERRQAFLIAIMGGAAALIVAALIVPPGSLVSAGVLVFSPSVQGFDLGGPAVFGDPNPLTALVFSLLFMLPVLFLSGYFPAVVKIATVDIQGAGSVFGTVLFWFTIGNVIGTYVTAIVLFEQFGTIPTLFICLGVLTLAILMIGGAVRPSAPRRLVRWAVPVAILVAVVILVPKRYYYGFGAGEYKPIDILEGRTGVLSVVPTKRFYTLLDMFRTESASAIHDLPEEGTSYELWRWNMSELLALDPAFKPKRILIIGVGHGYLARALIDYDFVEQVDIVELSPEVVEAVKKYSHPEVRRIYEHPKVRFIIDDGRRFVHKALARGEKYDLIQNRINEPWRAGSSSLFTVEFFKDLKGLLNPGGYVATREMIGYAVNGLQTFREAFWPGFYHIYFTDKPLHVPESVIVSRQLAPLFLARKPGSVVDELPEGRRSIRIVSLTSADAAGYQLNTDDRPTLEYRFLENRLRRYKDPKTFLDNMVMPDRTTELAVSLERTEGGIDVVQSPAP